MIDFVAKLKEEVDQKLRIIETREDNILKRALNASELFESVFDRLKEFITTYTFKDEEEEIYFFKEVKPRFFCHLIFYQKVYNIEMNRPIGCLDAQEEFLKHELNCIREYANKRLDFYRYYRAGSSHLDHYYFTRTRRDREEQYRDTFYFERDPVFSTSCDFKVAKILSNDMLQVYIREELELIHRQKYTFDQSPAMATNVVRWTDKKNGLIEILYSLDTLCSVEGGDISLKQLQSHFERQFGINLGNISRAFAEMRIRNNPTPFLDSMKEALLERMRSSEDRNIARNGRK